MRRPLSYKNQSIDLLCKSMGWFLHDRDLSHERVKKIFLHLKWIECQGFEICFLKHDYLSNLKFISKFSQWFSSSWKYWSCKFNQLTDTVSHTSSSLPFEPLLLLHVMIGTNINKRFGPVHWEIEIRSLPLTILRELTVLCSLFAFEWCANLACILFNLRGSRLHFDITFEMSVLYRTLETFYSSFSLVNSTLF